MTFAAIIFDCDGVLVDSEVLSVRGERRVLKEYGLDYTMDEFVRRFVGLHDRTFFDALHADYFKAHGHSAPANFNDQVLEGRRHEMHALTSIDGAQSALRAHPQVAVASSSHSHFLESKLKRTGLWADAAPHVYSADLVASGKPAPDIFLYTAEKMRVAPADCLVLEDSVNGVLAGVAAGMTVWGFTGGGHCTDGHDQRLRDAGARKIAPHFDTFVAWL